MVLVVAALVHQFAPPLGETPSPNILLVSIDTLRSDHLHCYGYKRETTPTIDVLAREGALFRTAVSSASWTLPAHVTLLTAKPPSLHSVTRVDRRLKSEAVSLAEVLRDNGYATAAFVAGPFLRAAYGHGQGFDLYDETAISSGTLADSHRGVTSSLLAELVNEWLQGWNRSDRSRPFFIFLHMWDPHYDFTPPPPYDTMFDPDYRGSVTGEEFETGTQVHPHMHRRDLEHVIALYDGEIRYTDEQLGRIVGELGRIGVVDDTIIVVTSDHGEEFFEHGAKGHAKSLYDESVRIPLVIRYPPRVPAGGVFERQVRLMDVAPTILGLANIEAPASFGTESRHQDRERDLSPWLIGARRPDTFPELLAYGDHRGILPRRSVRRADAKLILGRNGRERLLELYDLERDPAERNNLASRGAAPPEAEELRTRIDGWNLQWRGRSRLAAPLDLESDEEAQLRALGYVR